jgi:hypothetical protein
MGRLAWREILSHFSTLERNRSFARNSSVNKTGIFFYCQTFLLDKTPKCREKHLQSPWHPQPLTAINDAANTGIPDIP